jgi:DNA-binding transcriptional MerR regulator
MRIGQLADQAGVNVQTIRFYERRRILREPPRNASGYRSYGNGDLESIRFIKQSQELGFTLKEIQQLMKLHQAAAAVLPGAVRRPREWREIARITQARLEHIEQKLRLLRTMRMQLLSMLRRLETVSSHGCPASPKPARKSRT